MLFGIHYKSSKKAMAAQATLRWGGIYSFGTIDLRFTNVIEAIKTAKELQKRNKDRLVYRVFKEEKANEKLFTPDKIVSTMEEYFAIKDKECDDLLAKLEALNEKRDASHSSQNENNEGMQN